MIVDNETEAALATLNFYYVVRTHKLGSKLLFLLRRTKNHRIRKKIYKKIDNILSDEKAWEEARLNNAW